MVEHSGETSGEYELFHGSGKGEKRGGGVGHFCQNYPEITCFLRVPHQGRFSRYKARNVIRRVSRDELIYRHKFIPLPRLV